MNSFPRNDIRNIAFETINDRFSKGKYLGVEVTIDMTTGYINGPHLVGQVKTSNGKPKRFDHWRETALAKEIMVYLTPVITGVATIIDVTDAPVGLRGAYIHPRLVPHVAQWASPIFADKVAIILNDRAIAEAVAERDSIIGALKTDMARIIEQNDAQSAEIATLLAEVRAGREDNHHMSLQLDNVANDLDDAAHVNDQLVASVAAIAIKLDVATEQRVPPARPQSNEIFAVFHAPGTRAYRMVRRQKRSYKQGAAACTRDGYSLQVYYSDSPNAVNLGARIKDIMPVALGIVTGVNITLCPDKTAADLVAYMTEQERIKKDI